MAAINADLKSRDMVIDDLDSVVMIYKSCFADSVNVALGESVVRAFCRQLIEEESSLGVVLENVKFHQVIAIAAGTMKPGFFSRLVKRHPFLIGLAIFRGFFKSEIIRKKIFVCFKRVFIHRKIEPIMDDLGNSLPSGTELSHLFIAVHPEWQGHGNGSLILKYFAQRMFENGCRRIVGCVHVNNTTSLKLHGKLGWKSKQTSNDWITVWIHNPN